LPSFLTWRLWRALRYPDEASPLFQRIRAQPSVLPGQALMRRVAPALRYLAALISALLVLVAPGALLLMSNVFGALVALNVMNTINREREQGTYDLLALTPFGRGAANWQIAAACLSRLDAIERLASMRSLSLLTLILLAVYSMGRETLTPVLVFGVMLALNIDAIQTPIVGCLSGMLAQTFSGHSASFVAVAIFAFAQVILVYLPVAEATIVLYNWLHSLDMHRFAADAIVVTVALGLLFGLREVIIRLMWRELENRLL
jgi:hypothetical protein